MNEEPYFIVHDRNGGKHLKGSLLAKYVRENLQFILVRNSGKDDTQIYVYEKGVYVFCAPDTFKGFIKRFIGEYDDSLITMNAVNEAYNQLITDLRFVRIDDLNSDETIINFQNGILKLDGEKPQLVPHSPVYLSTVQLPCFWSDEEISTPVFDSFLDRLTNKNEKIKNLLLEFMGVVLSNVKGWRMKKALFLYGPGDTGKSQLKSLCELMLGPENYSSADFNEFEERFGKSAVYGKRLVGSADASHMSIKELKTFKKLTGGDSIQAEFKGRKAFDFVFNGLIWVCMNSLPKFGGDNGPWVYERIMVIECNNVIPKHEQDKQLLDKLFAERNGIIQKTVKALLTVIKNGYRFDETPEIIQMREKYMADNNTVITFFNECMVPRPVPRKITDSCTTGRLYEVYKAWCMNNANGFYKNQREFRSELCTIINGTYSELTVLRQGYRYLKTHTLSEEIKKEYVRFYGYDAVGT